jgi:glycosyltransferase involved in cell wall biosynthesis
VTGPNAAVPAEHMADVVLPCLDEASALPAVLAGLPPGYRAIVVDNGSTDESAAVAAACGALVVTEPQRGFGAACAAGLAAATAEFVCFCDADGSLNLGQLPRVLDPVRAGTVELMLGARRLTDRTAMPVHARIANRELARRLRRATGANLTDLGPMRAARRAPLVGLGITDRRSGWPLEMVLRAAAGQWRIAEVPVDYAPRTGKSKVTGTLRGTVTAVRDMQRAFREAQARAALPGVPS